MGCGLKRRRKKALFFMHRTSPGGMGAAEVISGYPYVGKVVFLHKGRKLEACFGTVLLMHSLQLLQAMPPSGFEGRE
ncbi:MAG: hypothetical protein A3K90_07355 [Pelodictyon luteolum]|uniref:Uncharacterized protein n=1 Tax=Pelodictyon luteolum TaxID=1100 RepID=A0A165LGV6_PELLU|nr:MAG: hypothetical protein A3K90_07355 [Pelodictyon luteolum]